MHFLLRSYVHFWNQYEKTDFFMPHSTYSKKKNVHLLEETMNFLRAEKVKNGRNRSKFQKTVFYKQILDFQCPSNILCHTSNLWNFIKITGSYPACYLTELSSIKRWAVANSRREYTSWYDAKYGDKVRVKVSIGTGTVVISGHAGWSGAVGAMCHEWRG